MRLLKIVSGYDSGGILTSEIAYSREMRKRGVVVEGLIIGEGPASIAYQQVFEAYLVDRHRFMPHGRSLLKRLFGNVHGFIMSGVVARRIISRGVIQGRYDAVTVRRPTMIRLAGLIGSALECPVMWHLPTAVSKASKRAYFRRICNRYNIQPIANSEFTRHTLWTQVVPVIYPGVQMERIKSSLSRDIRQELGIPRSAIVFGSVARLTFEKAHDIVVEAFVNSIAFNSGAHLVIGGGPLDTVFAQELRKKIEQYGNGQIHLIGEVRDVANVYAAMDVFINGRRNVEAFGISIVEAMAARLPVIAYYLGGPSETIIEGETGWLVYEPTTDGYKAAIDRAWMHRSAWADMGASAYSRAQKFTVRSQVSRYLDLLSPKPAE